MKVLIISSKVFYDNILPIKVELEKLGHQVLLPNCHDCPETEAIFREQGYEVHSKWKASMFKHSTDVITDVDAVLVLNFEKNDQRNYIGGATFLEMYDAFRLGKKIFLYNNIPDGMLRDEIIGFNPILIAGDLSKMV